MLIGVISVFPQQVRCQHQLAKITLELDAAYDDSGKSLQRLALASSLVPARPVEIIDSTDASTLLGRVFGVGISGKQALPRTFAFLLSEFRRLNPSLATTRLGPGTVWLPTLPQFSPKSKSRQDSMPNVIDIDIAVNQPRVTLGSVAFEVPIVTIQDRRVHGKSRETSTTLIRTEILPSVLENVTVSTSALVEQAPIRVIDWDMEVHFGNVSEATVAFQEHMILTRTARDSVRELLRRASRHVPLFILDSGWPTPVDQRDSFARLRTMMDTVRKAWGFKRNNLLNTNLPVYQDPTNKHVQSVARSLAELRALDERNRVLVVYIPLTPTQEGRDLLQELIELSLSLQAVNYRQGIRLTSEEESQIQSDASAILRGIRPYRAGDKTVGTNKAIVEAVANLGFAYASHTQSYFVISESWTVATNALRYSPPSPLSGIVVAAAGNDSTVNVHVPPYVDFARRSFNRDDVIAVVNMQPSGRYQCKSSRVESSMPMANRVFAVGYDGQILGDCGTSFSAPRVAWFIAVSEALRKETIAPHQWAFNLQERILHLRANTQTMYFDPLLFLKKDFVNTFGNR